MTRRLNSIVYLMVEEATREFESKLLIACALAESGVTSVVGQQWLLNDCMAKLPPGAVLTKGNNRIQAKFAASAKSAGHAVASIEEEALAITSEKEILRLYHKDMLQFCDCFLAQGKFQRDVLAAAHPAIAEKIKITGNSRIDLLNPEFIGRFAVDVERIRGEFGPFILVNTNFASINSRHGNVLDYYDLCVAVGVIDRQSPDDNEDIDAWCRWERANVSELVCLIADLRGRPDVKIVIRPHPSEKIELWQDGYRDQAGVRVVRERNHLPWLLAARVVVHTSCTTGAEAFLLGRPSVSLRPGGHAWHDYYLSNLVNITATDHRQASRQILDMLNGQDLGVGTESERSRFSENLARHIAQPGRGRLAADEIACALASLFPPDVAPIGKDWRPDFPLEQSSAKLDTQREKMNTTLDDARRTVDFFKQCTGRFDNIGIDQIGEATYLVRRNR